MNRIELLSPAGDYECFLAAINGGADAIYLSGDKFGARAYAKNFTQEELLKAIDYAHIFKRKIYLTVNTLLKDEEISELYNYIVPLYEAGLDGTIVQDMGVISYLRNAFPDLEVHASTQLAVTGLEGINLLKKEGVTRTVLAREVSLEEIEYIKKHSDMEIETFVHGALCYSYSGKCLFSSLAGGRSGNRGRCAGSCRQPYNDKYYLSTKDICCLSIIPELINSGIDSLKIEGRMKSPEYVFGVTSIYRKYIDIYYDAIKKMTLSKISDIYFKGPEFEKDFDILTRLYSRGGNSTGYYYKHNSKDMISISDASYKSDKGELKDSIKNNIQMIVPKIKIKGSVYIHPDEEISLEINDKILAKGAIASSAQNKPVTKDIIAKQLNKIKDTEFEFENIEYDISNDAFVRVSDLNELRRNAIDSYRESLLSSYKRKAGPKGVNLYSEHREYDSNVKNNKSLCDDMDLVTPIVSCDILNTEQLKTVLKFDFIKRVYIPVYMLLNKESDIIDEVHNKDKELYVKFQSVIRHNFLFRNHIDDIIRRCDGVLADSLEIIEYLKNNEFDKPVIGDIHVYALNNEAYKKYISLGLNTLTVPVELSKKELYRRRITGEELIIYGYLPMMISAQCINKTMYSCDKNQKLVKLKDRNGRIFTAVNNCNDCSNTIYNNVPISLHGEREFINRIKPASLRLSFTIEDKKRMIEVLKYFEAFCTDGADLKTIESPFAENTYTKGHLMRGIL